MIHGKFAMSSHRDCPPELVTAELTRILESASFSSAPQLKRLLNFVVASYLNNDLDSLKESYIGVAVFGKKPDYDPRLDSIVRTTAKRLRDRLQVYYNTEGKDDPLVISLPEGRYFPVFTVPVASPPVPAPQTVPDGQATEALQIVAQEPTSLVKRLFIELRWAWIAAIASALGLCLFVLETTAERKDGSPHVQQLTTDGRPKSGPVFADGSYVYFAERLGDRTTAVALPVSGGIPIALSVPSVELLDLLDMAPDHPEFLIKVRNPEGHVQIRAWVPGQTPRPVIGTATGSATWISENRFAHSEKDRLEISQHGSVLRTIRGPGWIHDLRWSAAQQLLRFSVLDLTTETHSVWQMHGTSSQPEPVTGLPPNSQSGAWAARSPLFVFLAKGPSGDDIWAVRQPALPFGSVRPFRLTDGQLSYSGPGPSPDGTTVFAIGEKARVQLMRYDGDRASFTPYLGGISGFELDFSHDGNWIAYVSYPDRTLWRMRVDGREATQLTFPTLQVIEPHWSPDDTRIAFMGQPVQGKRQIYVIPNDGGTPNRVTAGDAEEGVPTWSADGRQILFGELLLRKAATDMALHLINVGNGEVRNIRNSEGLWTPRWSPDGRFIAALTPDSQKLVLLNMVSGQRAELARADFIEFPAWTRGSSAVFFVGWKKESLDGKPVVDRVLWRVDIKRMLPERVVGLPQEPGLPQALNEWYGITPEGTPLALQAVRLQEVYAIPVHK
jgi:hypothetical protein